MMKRIVIFGSTGFLGRSIKSSLENSGFEIFDLNRFTNGNNSNHSYSVDFLKPNSWKSYLEEIKPDIVISTPWITSRHLWNSDVNFKYMEATINLAEYSFRQNVELFVGLGSSAEYGDVEVECDASRTPLKPNTAYGKSKARAGLEISKEAVKYGKDFKWCRIFQAYGNFEPSERFIPNAIKLLSRGETLLIKNSDRVLDWINADDIGHAITFIINQKIDHHFLDVGTALGTKVIDVAHTITKHLNISSNLIEIDKTIKFRNTSRLVCSKQGSLFTYGWKPKVDLDEGIKRLVHM